MGTLANEVNARLAEARAAEEGYVTRYLITDAQRRDINDLRTRLAPRVPLFERMGFDQISDVQNFNAEIQGTRVGTIFFGLEEAGVLRNPNQTRLLRTLGDQFQPNQRNGSVIDQLNADLNANPSLVPRLQTAIRNNPNAIADILPSYNAANGAAGTRILTQTLDRLVPVPRSGPTPTRERPAPARADSRPPPAASTTTADVGAAPPPPADGTTGGQPQPGAAAPPPEPPRYTPPATLDNDSYAQLIGNLGAKVTILMPAGMGDGNDSAAFLQRLEDPAFRDRFIQLYNSDPQYRQAIQNLYQDADALAQRRERSGDRAIDPDSEIGRRIGVLQGQFRGVMTNPDDLLNVNRVMELQEGVSGLRNFAGSMNGMLDQAPPWIRAMLQPILEIFDIFRPAFSRAGLAEGMGYMQNAFGAMGINLAGNGGGNMLGGLFGGLLGGTGGAGTGGAPPPPAPAALASTDGTGGPRNPTPGGPQAGPTGQPIVPAATV